MQLQIIDGSFTVCQVSRITQKDLQNDFCFIGKTDQELSLVCRTENTPSETITREDSWRAFRVVGVLDFSLIGILASLSELLAKNGISIFAVSTFNTDYLLIKQEHWENAVRVLRLAGHTFLNEFRNRTEVPLSKT